MISYLRGKVQDIEEGRCTVMAGGVGYDVQVGRQALPPLGSDIELFIHWHQKDEAPSLFGFLDLRARTAFRHVLTIHGVGPRLALGLVSGLGLEKLMEAIREGDSSALGSVPGLGQKRAQRILQELREKFPGEDRGEGESGRQGEGEADEVVQGLRGLGYSHDEIENALKDLPPGTSEKRMREALSRLASGGRGDGGAESK